MKSTKWYVITGQPSSGKTTIIERLSEKGYRISEEVARRFYLMLLKNQKENQILVDRMVLQKQILDIELARENCLNPNEVIFFDRAIPDSIAYYRMIGEIPEFVIKAAKRFRYQQIFFLEPLPFEVDGVRQEDAETADILGRYIYDAYVELGYEIVRVPVLPVAERVEYILDRSC